MPELPLLTVPDIRTWAGDRNLTKGQPYFRGGALRNLRRQGLILRGECQGTSPAPYQVEIRLDADGIASGTCTCPVGYGGRCKHGAALLLAWLHQTEAFVEVVDVAEALSGLDHDQLARVVTQLYARFPQVAVWLDMELTQLARIAAPEAATDPAAIGDDALTLTSSVSRALDEAHTYHQDAQVLPRAVADALTAARATAAQGDHARAATLYWAVVEGVIEALHHALEDAAAGPDEYDEYDRSSYYEEDDYFETMAATRLPILALDDAVPGLGACLEHLGDAAQRSLVIDQLYDVLTMDVESYMLEGATFPNAIDLILTERTTPDERRDLIERFQADRPRGEWDRKEYDLRHRQLVLDLAHGLLNDDAYLALCRDLEAHDALLDELLRLGRVDDAVAELRIVANPLLFEGVFSKHGQGDRFFAGVRHLPRAESDQQLVTWLRDRAEACGDLEDALVLARRAFDGAPSTVNYRALRGIATTLARWEPLRRAIFERESKANHWPTVTELYLEDQEIDHALEALKHVADPRQDPLYSSAISLRLKVAAAAESTRPDAALVLYVAAAEYLVSYRGRAYYARAGELLGRVRELYRAQEQGAIWQTLITRFREEYRRLPALQDELKQAKLFEREPTAQRAQPSAPGIGLSVAPNQLPPAEHVPSIHVIRAPESPLGS
jgi:uncharacterized Zn finger protein